MAKDQDTFAKRRREVRKKHKAEEKRERRRKKKEQTDNPIDATDTNTAADDTTEQ